MFVKKLKNLGPGLLVTSAFIGPGTVTVCSLAGYQFGYVLLWALLFSVFATIILQEMSARLGIITQQGLSNAFYASVDKKWLRIAVIFLIFSAIVIGNGAYEAGNISGATLGINTVFNTDYSRIFSVSVGLLAFCAVMSGSYKIIERLMITLVLLMSLVFISTAIYIKPDVMSLLKGLFVPSLPSGSVLLAIGLIGTTVVPYNLFLHASASATKWKNPDQLPEARFDTFVSIIIGGVISMAILITSASTHFSGPVSGANDLALQLEPLLGRWAKYFIAIGLFAAGISSSITAPLAAGYAASGIFNFPARMNNLKFRAISGIIVLIGVGFSAAGFKPVEVIKFAQVTNGILLPILSIFLVWMMNNKQLLGNYVNNRIQNFLGISVIIVSLVLGVKTIISVIVNL